MSYGHAAIIFCWPATILMTQSAFGRKTRGQRFGQLQPLRSKIKTVQNGEPNEEPNFNIHYYANLSG